MNLFFTHLPAYEDGTECSETSAYKIQTPGNNPEESKQQLIWCMLFEPCIVLYLCNKNQQNSQFLQ